MICRGGDAEGGNLSDGGSLTFVYSKPFCASRFSLRGKSAAKRARKAFLSKCIGHRFDSITLKITAYVCTSMHARSQAHQLLFFFFPSLIWLIIDLGLLSSVWVIVLVAARLCGSGFVFLVVDRAEWTVSAQVDACLEQTTMGPMWRFNHVKVCKSRIVFRAFESSSVSLGNH